MPHEFITNLDCAIDCFRPILECLEVKGSGDDKSIGLSLFPHIKDIYSINKWEIVFIKTDLKDENAKAYVILKIMEFSEALIKCYIIIDNLFYPHSEKTQVLKETRMMVVIHELVHFIAFLYARINNTPRKFVEILNKRLSKSITILSNKAIQDLYQFFNKIRLHDEFNGSEHTNDKHFRVEKSDTTLTYDNLYRNLLLSHVLFDEYFLERDKEEFRYLWKGGKYEEANKLYYSIARKVALEEWIPENLALNQAYNILLEYYSHTLLK